LACPIRPLNKILSILLTNRTYEGIAIGGDSYPGTTFLKHLMRYEQRPECKMLVLLGEVGGFEESGVIEAVRSGAIRKVYAPILSLLHCEKATGVCPEGDVSPPHLESTRVVLTLCV
jgi:succinyl-CoA synthetase alpha subunit